MADCDSIVYCTQSFFPVSLIPELQPCLEDERRGGSRAAAVPRGRPQTLELLASEHAQGLRKAVPTSTVADVLGNSQGQSKLVAITHAVASPLTPHRAHPSLGMSLGGGKHALCRAGGWTGGVKGGCGGRERA